MKFPTLLYVTIENPANGLAYADAHFSVEEAAEIGEAKKVGIYKLERISKVSADVKVK